MPDDMTYYHEIDNVIERIQQKKSIIPEAREEMEGLGTWEETPEEEEVEEKKDEFSEIKQGYQEGLNALNNTFIDPLFGDIQSFVSDTSSAALKGPEVMIKALEEMRDSIESGLSRVQSYFESTLNKEIGDVNKSIEDQIKKYVREQMEIPKKIQGLVQNLSASLGSVIGSQLESTLEGILTALKKVVMNAEKIGEKQVDFSKAVTNQDATIQKFAESLKTTGDQISTAISNLPKTVNNLITKKTDSFKSTVEDLKSTTSQLKAELESLQKIIMSKRK
jgi:phage-related protein